jgi:hypothetical protein
MSAPAFDLGSFVRGLLALPHATLVTLENQAEGLLAAICQGGAGQFGVVMDNRLMLTGPWEKVQPWLAKNLRLGPGARLLANFKFAGEQERAVLTALDKQRRQHGLKPLLAVNTWVYPPLSADDGSPLSRLSTVATLVG